MNLNMMKLLEVRAITRRMCGFEAINTIIDTVRSTNGQAYNVAMFVSAIMSFTKLYGVGNIGDANKG